MKISLVTKLPDEVQAVIDQQNREAAQSLQIASQINQSSEVEEVNADTKQTQQ